MNANGQEIIDRKERMELDGTLLLAVMRPVEEAKAKGDEAGIQQHDARGFDATSESADEGLLSQLMMKQAVNVTKDHGITTGILMTQGVAGRSASDSRMVEPATDGTHAFADIAQRLTVGRRAEKKRDEMGPGIQVMAKLVGMEPFCGSIDGLFQIR